MGLSLWRFQYAMGKLGRFFWTSSIIIASERLGDLSMLGSRSSKIRAADKGNWPTLSAVSVWGVCGRSPSFCSRRQLLTELLVSPALGPSTARFHRCNTANTIRPQRNSKHKKRRNFRGAQTAILPVNISIEKNILRGKNYWTFIFSIWFYRNKSPAFLRLLNASQWMYHH